MRSPFRFLLILALLWSGLHLGEPAHAGEDALQHQLEHSSHMPETGDEEGQPGHVSHAGHHHCPLAPDQVSEPAATRIVAPGTKPCGRPAASLPSLSQAPPLQPPSA